MFYRDWEPIYKKITKDFNFSIEQDEKAAELLEQLLKKKSLFSIDELDEMIKGKEVFIFGAGPSLVNSIKKHKKDFSNKLKIAADGATSALIKNGILPEIIVTDLDGKISDQIKANSNGSIAIIHAHGDNIPKLDRYIPKFKKLILGTTQTNPKSFENVFNFGGFTDGDRAIFLADRFNAKKIFLIGFDFNDEIGKYSFSEKKDKNLKLKKLKWCKYLIGLLTKNKNRIYFIK